MNLTFDNIINELICGESGKYVCDGTSASIPVIGKGENGNIDCFLLYDADPYREKIYHAPYARLVIDALNKNFVEYKTAEELPFDYKPDEEEPFKMTTEENETYYEKYIEYASAYLKFRKIAFKDAISSKAKEELKTFIENYNAIEQKEICNYAVKAFPDFFDWVKRVLESDEVDESIDIDFTEDKDDDSKQDFDDDVYIDFDEFVIEEDEDDIDESDIIENDKENNNNDCIDGTDESK